MVSANLFARDWLDVASNCIEYFPLLFDWLTGATGLVGFGADSVNFLCVLTSFFLVRFQSRVYKVLVLLVHLVHLGQLQQC